MTKQGLDRWWGPAGQTMDGVKGYRSMAQPSYGSQLTFTYGETIAGNYRHTWTVASWQSTIPFNLDNLLLHHNPFPSRLPPLRPLNTLRGHVRAGVDAVLGEGAALLVSMRTDISRREQNTYGRATSKRFSICLSTSWSASLLTNEMARPLVPKRPARPTRCRYESASAGRS
jgi:hypothetical protein